MNIKNIFKRNSNLSEIENIPVVIFDDTELEIEVGRWLGILSLPGMGSRRKTKISDREDEKISNKFGLVLSLAGINKDELCILDNYNSDKFSFDCYFFNSDEHATISLNWGSLSSGGPEFIIEQDNMRKTYAYRDFENNPVSLNLENYTFTNDENGHTCYRYLSPFSSYFEINDGKNKLLLSVREKENLSGINHQNYVARLRNESDLERYLLGLEFPVEIDDVYKKVSELSLGPVDDYHKISLKVEKNVNDKETVMTDSIFIKDGKMMDFMVTRSGKTISIDSAGNWSYKSPEVTAKEEDKLSMTFNIQDGDIANTISPMNELNKINSEVRQVKQLAKTIFK